MANAKDLRRMALALEGTTEAPHFDRAAFKVTRIYVTLAADGRTANFKFTPDEQELKLRARAQCLGPAGLDDGQALGIEYRRPRGRAGDGLAACRTKEASAQIGFALQQSASKQRANMRAAHRSSMALAAPFA